MWSPQCSSYFHDVRALFVTPVFNNTVTELDFHHYRVLTVLVVVYMESVIFKFYLEKECLMISGSESSRESKIEGRGRERNEEGTLEEPERCSLTTVFGEHQRERSGRERQLDSLGPVCPTPPCKVASLADLGRSRLRSRARLFKGWITLSTG